MTLRYFRAEDGARLAYRDEGHGKPLLALAGLTRDGRDFDYLAPHLAGIRLLRLDSRGRGGSDWTGAQTYNVVQETRDAVAFLDHLAVPRAAVLGSSRGGLIGLLMAATARNRVTGLCLNDIGPDIERAGLKRIAAYVGIPPAARSLRAIAEGLSAAMPGFANVPPRRWLDEAARHYTQLPDAVGLTYDPALKQSFDASLSAPPDDLWPFFDACAGLPLALIRGANSDVLSRATADRMQMLRPDLIRAEVPDRGHIPFLDEPAVLTAIRKWLARIAP